MFGSDASHWFVFRLKGSVYIDGKYGTYVLDSGQF